MRLLTVNKLLAIGVAAVILAVADSPRLFYLALSPDRQLLPETAVEVQVFRWVMLVMGLLIMMLPLIWALCARKRFRQRIIEEYEAYVDGLDNEDTHSGRMLAVWLAILGATFAGLLLTMRLSHTYQGKGIAWYDWIALEDGFWETGTALCMLAAGLLIIFECRKRKGVLSRPMGSILPVLLALALIFAAGEEMSWGQRWLGYATPEAMKEINVQGEFTLHNMGGRWANQVMILFFVGYIGIAPLLSRYFVDMRFLYRWLNVPMAPEAFAPFAFVSVLMDERQTFSRIWGNPPWYLDEGREVMFGVAMLGVAVCWAALLAKRNINKKTRDPSRATPATRKEAGGQ